jgi:hypothetical protein
MPNVVSFRRGNWTAAEREELYALARCFTRKGLRASPWTGVSDEGDPWFAIVNPTNHATLIHVTRTALGYAAFGDNLLVHHYHRLSDLVKQHACPNYREIMAQAIGFLGVGLVCAGCFVRVMYSIPTFIA